MDSVRSGPYGQIFRPVGTRRLISKEAYVVIASVGARATRVTAH